MCRSLAALLVVTFVASVSAYNQRTNILWPVGSRDLVPEHLKDAVAERAAPLITRQSDQDPPTTTVAQCDTYDGYFYVTPGNYTWQLQCTTNYQGTLIAPQTADSYSACIGECITYNQAHGAGACLAITFNGEDGGAQGLCSLWSSVDSVSQAYEEGNVEDSALLVRGPDGTVYATPRADPSFSSQPLQQRASVPDPSSTQLTTTVFSTSVVLVTSCPPGLSCPALFSTTPAVPPVGSSSSPYGPLTSALASPSSSVPMSIGVPILATTTMASQSPSPTFPPSSGVGGQTTFTTVNTYTEYLVDAVTNCPAAAGPCTVLTETSTITGYRTQLSCSPGVCTGAMINTQVFAAFTAATCIQTA